MMMLLKSRIDETREKRELYGNDANEASENGDNIK